MENTISSLQKQLNLFKHFIEDLLTPIIKQSVEDAVNNVQKQHGSPTSNHNAEEIYDLNEAVRFLGLAKPTLYEFTSNKEIPHYKKGKKLYFKKTELIQWIELGKQKTKSELSLAVEEYLKNKASLKK